MSRYSRNFDDPLSATKDGAAGYSRFDRHPRKDVCVSCRMCDGSGSFAGDHGNLPCDLCQGAGVVPSGAQDDVALFRPRSTRGPAT